MIDDETAEGVIVAFPDIVSVISRGRVRAGEFSMQNTVNTIGKSEGVELATPIDPV